MDEKPIFAKNIKIQIRSNNFQKKNIKARAEKLGVSMSQYIRLLIEKDLRENKRDGIITKNHPL